MEVVFITIHDLSLDARIKYCSASVEEVLGYKPNEVRGKSCWEYFHPDELPFAKAIHGKGLDLQKAAALNYCRIKHKDGSWRSCECVFTIVYDVLVASTAIYKCGSKSQSTSLLPAQSIDSVTDYLIGRAVEGAAVRRVFSSTPRDPRYHMLSWISDKFSQSYERYSREPRAALILNRFTRTSTILFATNGVEEILGFSPLQLVGKSFYYCIAENCMSEAVRTLESAKGNDSIAYLRFFFRDPTLPDPPPIDLIDSDSDEESDGGVRLRSSRSSTRSSVDMESPPPLDVGKIPEISINSPPLDIDGTVGSRNMQDESPEGLDIDGIPSRTSSGNSTDLDGNGQDGVFDEPMYRTRSSASSITPQETPSPGVIEIEAVVSCTSDGLVVVLRRAKAMIPQTVGTPQPQYPDGLFASPWADRPVVPDSLVQATSVPNLSYPPASEPSESGLMAAIREVAVFAWSLTGINGALIDKKAKGTPQGQAIPPGGLPIWDPNAPVGQNDCYNGFSGGTHRPVPGMGDPRGIDHRDGDITSSDDEIVWKRVPQMPAYKKPKRRAHMDAFGDEGEDSTDNGGVQVQDRRRRKLENGERQNS